MSDQGKKNQDGTVFWWLGWITLTIVSFFIACYFWTGFIAKYIGSMDRPGLPILWVATVFGTWMIMLVPLIVMMYNKVDRSYEDARLTRESAEYEKAKKYFGVRGVLVPEEDRALPKAISDRLKTIPTAIKKGHLVTIVTKSGKRIEHVFIFNRTDVLGVYDVDSMPFKVSDIVDVVASNLDALPNFESRRWLRLDGVGV